MDHSELQHVCIFNVQFQDPDYILYVTLGKFGDFPLKCKYIFSTDDEDVDGFSALPNLEPLKGIEKFFGCPIDQVKSKRSVLDWYYPTWSKDEDRYQFSIWHDGVTLYLEPLVELLPPTDQVMIKQVFEDIIKQKVKTCHLLELSRKYEMFYHKLSKGSDEQALDYLMKFDKLVRELF